MGKKAKKMEMTKKKTWTYTFVCLSQKDQDSIPDAEERMMLQLAGLGEKSFLS